MPDSVHFKRFHQATPEYFDFGPYFSSNLETLATMSMSFLKMPFGAGNQFMQSPPCNSQFPASAPEPGPSSPP
ncbi:MAG: hypothetical protein AB2556_24165, partial [Candidatus Thiodiazotropha sp.]